MIGWPAVYRIYDEAGALLYVGSTASLERRIRTHRKGIRGFHHYSATWHASMDEAQRIERAAIYAEAPVFNQRNNHKRWTQVGREWVRVDGETWPEGLPGVLLQRMAERGETIESVGRAVRISGATIQRRIQADELHLFRRGELDAIAGALGLERVAA